MKPFEQIPHLHGVTMTKAELANALGETLATLDAWVRTGCPCRRTGGLRSALMFDSAQVIAWRTIEAVRAAHGDQAAAITRLTWERDALEAELARRA